MKVKNSLRIVRYSSFFMLVVGLLLLGNIFISSAHYDSSIDSLCDSETVLALEIEEHVKSFLTQRCDILVFKQNEIINSLVVFILFFILATALLWLYCTFFSKDKT